MGKKKKKERSMFRDIGKNGVGLLLSKQNMEVKASARLILAPKVYEQMMTFAELTHLEISGFGIVERVDAVTFRVDENLIVPKQVNTSGNTKMDNDDLAAITMAMIAAGQDHSKMRLWWHSHNSMATFWSATDNTCCDNFDNGEYLISVVVNHKRELRARIDIYKPLRIVIDCVDVVIDTVSQTERNEMIEHCKQIMTQKTSMQTYTPVNYHDYRTEQNRCKTCGYLTQYCDCHVNKHKEQQGLMEYTGNASGLAFGQIPTSFETFIFDMNTLGFDPNQTTDIMTCLEEYQENFKNQKWQAKVLTDIFGIQWQWSHIDRSYEPVKKGWAMKDFEYLAAVYQEFLMRIKPHHKETEHESNIYNE